MLAKSVIALLFLTSALAAPAPNQDASLEARAPEPAVLVEEGAEKRAICWGYDDYHCAPLCGDLKYECGK
ncbi:hypothetical protein Q8F55_005775 [Vanrija albida]|uniref:Uncharacterized protein n=1 Tax=Vanrija albida TaxID=181172 RepID=A0ABR3Q3D1_9TREE